MREVVVVEAVRSPIGKRNGGLSTVHPTILLSTVLKELIRRSGIAAAEVEQVIGGCVSQVGEQSFNVTRTSWLTAGLPVETAATTVDTQCGSSQQATNIATAMVASGVVDVAVACGVESMTRIPIGANSSKKLGLGVPITKDYFANFEFTSQFEGADRIAQKWGITRDDTNHLGVRSQQLAAQAWSEGRFDSQVTAIDVPEVDDEGKPTGSTHKFTRDEGLRETTLEKLETLKVVGREDGVHSAGTSSQISDGAAALLVMTPEKVAELGLTPRARIVDTCLVGVDPVLMLTGPIDATRRLLSRTGRTMSDIDTFEINEAFASVVLAWAKELDADMDRVNPNGGAIALGHPLGATGAFLLTKALYELERTDASQALIAMCCGGGLGTGTLIERL